MEGHACQTSGCVLSIMESAVPTDAVKRSRNGLWGITIDTTDRLQKDGMSLCYPKLVARRKHTRDKKTHTPNTPTQLRKCRSRVPTCGKACQLPVLAREHANGH
jgi:hypothetical protein